MSKILKKFNEFVNCHQKIKEYSEKINEFKNKFYADRPNLPKTSENDTTRDNWLMINESEYRIMYDELEGLDGIKTKEKRLIEEIFNEVETPEFIDKRDNVKNEIWIKNELVKIIKEKEKIEKNNPANFFFKKRFINNWEEYLSLTILKLTKEYKAKKEKIQAEKRTKIEIKNEYEHILSSERSENLKIELKNEAIQLLLSGIVAYMGYNYNNQDLPTNSLNLNISTPPSLNNLSLSKSDQLVNGNPTHYNNSTHCWQEPVLETPSTGFLTKLETQILDKFPTNFNIGGDVDDLENPIDSPKTLTSSSLDNAEKLMSKVMAIHNELDEWNKEFPKQKPTEVKKERDAYRQQAEQAENYAKGLTNLGIENLTEWEKTIQEWKNQAERVPDLSQRPDITVAELAKYKNPQQVAEIEKEVRENEAQKYHQFINPKNTTAILVQASQQGVKFTQLDLDKAVNQTKDKYSGYKSPSEVKVAEENLNKITEERNSRPNITFTEYNELQNNQKPLDWEEKLNQIPKLEKENKELKNNQTTLENDFTKYKEEYTKLEENQKPDDLPENWKSELSRISQLEENIKKQGEQINNLSSRPNISQKEFSQYKSPEKVAELEKSVREAVAAKYEGFIDPKTQPEKIINIARQAGYQFKQDDINKAVKEKENEWIKKNLINPNNYAELLTANLVKKVEHERIKTELSKESGRLTQEQNAHLTTSKKYAELEVIHNNLKHDKSELENKLANLTIQNESYLNATEAKARGESADVIKRIKIQQTQSSEQTSHSVIWDIFQCLTSAGVGFGVDRVIAQKNVREVKEKIFKELYPKVNEIIKQRDQAWQLQQQTEVEKNNLQNWKDNHVCSLSSHTCPLNHLPTPHVCPTCSHSDYEEIKEQLAQQKTACELEKKELENTIISKIITELSLDTPQKAENALELVITELKSKLKPDGSDKQTISELETQLVNARAERNKPTAEMMKKISEQLKDNQELLTRAQNAPTYSELFATYEESVKEKLNHEVVAKNQVKQLNIFLGVLSISSLLILAAILIKSMVVDSDKKRLQKTLTPK